MAGGVEVVAGPSVTTMGIALIALLFIAHINIADSRLFQKDTADAGTLEC